MKWNELFTMKKMGSRVACVLGCLLLVAISNVQAAQRCNLATLSGGYGTSTTNGQDTASGRWTFDGAGNVSGVYRGCGNGGCGAQGTFQGTYKVRSDCTGSFSLDFGRFYVVIVHGGDEFFSINKDFPIPSILEGKRQQKE